MGNKDKIALNMQKKNNNKTKPKYDKSTECNYMYNVQTIDLNTIFITGGFKEFSSLYPQHCRCQSKLPTSCTLETPDNAHKQVITHPGDWEQGGGGSPPYNTYIYVLKIWLLYKLILVVKNYFIDMKSSRLKW